MEAGYRYTVEATSEAAGHYVACLMRLHGLAYDWQVLVREEFNGNDVRVCVQALPEGLDSSVAELIFSENPSLLASYGIAAHHDHACAVTHLALLDPAFGHFVAFPTSWQVPTTIAAPDGDWTVRAQLILESGEQVPLLVQRAIGTRRQAVFCGAIIGLLDDALLGPHHARSTFEDWSEVFGVRTQAMALACAFERLLRFLRNVLTEIAPAALPAILGYYPPGRTAPLLLTGDTDDATPRQFSMFLEAVERANGMASLLVRSFDRYSAADVVDAAGRGHGIGLHPYSDDGSEVDFQRDFGELTTRRNALLRGRIGGVRNHRFQWVARNQATTLERCADVAFDLNCVAASGASWIGSGSGIAFPIPFPPTGADATCAGPFHLPTAIEDDVFLYDYDYCYVAHQCGESSTQDLVSRFLATWLLDRGWPVVVNLHPQHVDVPHNWVMDEVLSWAATAQVWMPTLETFMTWIETRLHCHIQVVDRGTVHVSASDPVVIRASRGLQIDGVALCVLGNAEGRIVLSGSEEQCLL